MQAENATNSAITADPFLLGINYWPRSSGMQMWQAFDRGEIREDFARIAALGMHALRFFLRWDDFQPAPDTMNRDVLRKFDWFMETLTEFRLLAMPTFFTGHMSGVNWLPAWTLDLATDSGRFRTICGDANAPHGSGDTYTGALLDAQRLHVHSIAERVRGYPHFLSWDLGNEFSNVREPASPADAAAWSRILTDDLRSVADYAVTGGTHGEDITRDRGLRLSSICEPWKFATMHGYSVYSDFSRGRMDSDVVPFLAEVARSCSGKGVLFSEFGNPTCPPGTVSPSDGVLLPGEAPRADAEPAPGAHCAAFACLEEEEMPVYARRVLDRLHHEGALGAFWWCWADYAASLQETPPFDRARHELHFGIIRNDGSEKPIAAELRRFAAEDRSVRAAGPALFDESEYFAQLPDGVRSAYAYYLERRGA